MVSSFGFLRVFTTYLKLSKMPEIGTPSKIDTKKKEFHKNKVILQYIQNTKDRNDRLHFLGLISHITHLYALFETAKEQNVPNVYVHFSPRSSAKYSQDLLDFIKKDLDGYGQLATILCYDDR
ncbi:hypothetical protein L218DRAFT_351613 [Marasmius fiardii PR-910]|nr:hypothetical protein L218DRAFT_351613 [Marasmius fiardii PR-910]